MARILLTCSIVICTIVLMGCATGANGGKDGFVEEGAILLMDNQVIDAFKGNTLKGVGWAVYNRKDGVRLIHLDSGAILVRKWWINHSGQWCLTTSKGKRVCGPKVYKLGDVYREFAGKTSYTYEIFPGNPLNLKEE